MVNHDFVPPNIKISPQKRFYQTAKEKKPIKTDTKNTDFVRYNCIKESLLLRGKSFTDPISSEQDIHRTLYNVCGYSISALHLKSLDTYINNNELNMLTSADPHFHTGWLYDNVINVF